MSFPLGSLGTGHDLRALLGLGHVTHIFHALDLLVCKSRHIRGKLLLELPSKKGGGWVEEDVCWGVGGRSDLYEKFKSIKYRGYLPV